MDDNRLFTANCSLTTNNFLLFTDNCSLITVHPPQPVLDSARTDIEVTST